MSASIAGLTPSASGPRELRLEDLQKSYGGIRALHPISTTFRPGLTGIVGDNGAGKSTLMKIISGVARPDAGRLWLGSEELHLTSPSAARHAGVESLYQDLALADTLDVTKNIFLGRELTRSVAGLKLLRHRAMAKEATETLAHVAIRIPDVGIMVRSLSGGQRQAVALARAVRFDAPVILLDEPTAALVGMASHIVVMRAGRIVWEVDPRQTSQEELLAYMVGTRV